MLGNIVNSQQATDNSVLLDLTGYSKGIYFVRIVSTGSTTGDANRGGEQEDSSAITHSRIARDS